MAKQSKKSATSPGPKRRPRGSVYPVKGGLWKGALPVAKLGGGKRKLTASFPTEAEAREWLKQMKVRYPESHSTPDALQTVGEQLLEWLEAERPKWKYRTEKLYRDAVERQLLPHFGDTRLRELTALHIEGFIRVMFDHGYSQNSIRLPLAALKGALKRAKKHGRIPISPYQDIEVPKTPGERFDPPGGKYARRRPPKLVYTAAQSMKLLETTARHRLEAAFVILITCGLRRAEVCGLRWQDVDFEAGILHVRKQLVYEKRRYFLTDVKSEESQGTVEAPGIVFEALARHRTRQARELAESRAENKHDLVFLSSRGTPMNPAMLLQRFYTLVRWAGLPRTTLHRLRHGVATLLSSLGIDGRIIQSVLRHASIVTTMDTYTHVLGGVQRDALEKLAEKLKAPSKPDAKDSPDAPPE